MQKKQFVLKGIFFGLFGIIGFSNFTYALTDCELGCKDDFTCLSDCATKANLAGVSNTQSTTQTDKTVDGGLNAIDKTSTTTDSCKSSQCQDQKDYAACAKKCEENPSYTTKPDDNPTTTEGDETVMGITMGPNCLKNGQCSFKIYDLLGIKQDMPAESRTSATFFVQDILLAATFFIGTIITIALLRSGVMYILAGATGKDPSNAKKGITYSIIGLLLVISSYAIIRLVQYIAKGL